METQFMVVGSSAAQARIVHEKEKLTALAN